MFTGATSVQTNEEGDHQALLPLLKTPSELRTRSWVGENPEISEIFSTKREGNNLGTLKGVFLPALLGIFGVVVFLRLGYIIGQVGVETAYLMLCLGYIIASLTYLSLSAVATNGIIKGGGAYYLISRSLGPEFGGSIGIIFYVANISAAALTLLGGAEAVMDIIPSLVDYLPSDKTWSMVIVAIVVLFFMFLIAIAGADLYTKFALLFCILFLLSMGDSILGMLFISGGSLGGAYHKWSPTVFRGNMGTQYCATSLGSTPNWGTIFAIVFPAITGFNAGANMSGDLRKPSKSIPKGTFFALVFTFGFYTVLLFLLAGTVDRSYLQDNANVLASVSLTNHFLHNVPFFVGELVFTFASALACIVGASRILQAVGKDDVFPLAKYMAKGYGHGGEPRRAVVFSTVFIAVFIFMFKDGLNSIAPFNTLSYLLSYFAINFSCFVSTIAGLPNFRPTFEYYGWWTAALGSIISIVYMFLISAKTAGIIIGLFVVSCIGIHFYAPPKEWGDITQAILYHQVRKYLLRLDERKRHVKTWRLSLLHLVSSPVSSNNVIHFANALKKGGLYIIGHVVVGRDEAQQAEARAIRTKYLDYIEASRIKAFADITLGESLVGGVLSLIQLSGLGGMRPNTVLLGLPGDERKRECTFFADAKHRADVVGVLGQFAGPSDGIRELDFTTIVTDIVKSKLNLIIHRNFDKLDQERMQPGQVVGADPSLYTRQSLFVNSSFQRKWIKKEPRLFIDIWIRDQKSVHVPLLLAHLLHESDQFSHNTHLRVISIVDKEVHKEQRRKLLHDILTFARVQAFIKVVSLEYEDNSTNQPYSSLSEEEKARLTNAVIRRHSNQTAVTILGVSSPLWESEVREYLEHIKTLTHDIPPCLCVYADEHVITTEL